MGIEKNEKVSWSDLKTIELVLKLVIEKFAGKYNERDEELD